MLTIDMLDQLTPTAAKNSGLIVDSLYKAYASFKKTGRLPDGRKLPKRIAIDLRNDMSTSQHLSNPKVSKNSGGFVI